MGTLEYQDHRAPVARETAPNALAERQRQILTLLGYPRVGPLTTAAIAHNLATDEHDLQPDLEALLRAQRLIRLEDGRLTLPRPQSETHERAMMAAPEESHGAPAAPTLPMKQSHGARSADTTSTTSTTSSAAGT